MNENVLCGIIYIHVPPENSSYCIVDSYNKIENEYIRFSDNFDHICLLGDFNSRVAEENDFNEIMYDEFSGMLGDQINGSDILSQLNVPLNRTSCDRGTILGTCS